MQENNVANVLRGLATGNSARSETARLRDVLAEIEATLAAGVNRAAILEALRAGGFTMTLKSFESALYRIRKQRGQFSSVPPPSGPLLTSAPAIRSESEKLPPLGVGPVSDEPHGLSDKQLRDRVAEQFIKTAPTNPLLQRIKDQRK